MGSRSTCIKAKIGGVEGRALRKEDVLRRCAGERLRHPRVLPPESIPAYPAHIVLRAIPGPQEEVFGKGLDLFFDSYYDITPDADRMGYRLQGPPVHHDEGYPQSIISEPTIPGNVQLPADGQPIILLVEQTTGGYTKIATVISSDISKIAQAIPGNRVRFQRVSLEEAHRIIREQTLQQKQIEEQLSAGP
jgi:allophanate hydrolase subunit 2